MSKTKAEIQDIFKNSFREYDAGKSAYILLVDGKRVKVRNGKSVWNTAGAAKNALRNHFNNYSYLLNDLDRVEREQIEDEWIEQHARVVSVSEYEAARAKLKAK